MRFDSDRKAHAWLWPLLIGVAIMIITGCNLVGQSDVVELNVSTMPDHAGMTSPPSRTFNAGEEVTLRAIPGYQNGFNFQHWSGDLESSENPARFRITSDMNVVAHFVPQPWTLTIRVEGNGRVQHRLADSDEPYRTEPESTYPNGYLLELVATPDPGWELDYWWGENFNLRSSDNPVVFGIWHDQEVTAIFREVSP